MTNGLGRVTQSEGQGQGQGEGWWQPVRISVLHRPHLRTGLEYMDAVRPQAWTGRAQSGELMFGLGRTAVDCQACS